MQYFSNRTFTAARISLLLAVAISPLTLACGANSGEQDPGPSGDEASITSKDGTPESGGKQSRGHSRSDELEDNAPHGFVRVAERNQAARVGHILRQPVFQSERGR